ncbi:hypothetical protein KDL01_35380 [Actinospica durhamensis]|uniref:Uncharacterized protein n=1 Tax=Actinospica durhamensis TaxID=1508375 RepID=A0A941ISK3_9ACTN|nr:hypothetical protein [Actinospica durhamensis]MBR7838604.1 hypothetical protein [Actinospica durhamensis]
MGITRPRQFDHFNELTRRLYGDVLRDLKLTDESIDAQDLHQLEDSLALVNDAIQHSDRFSTYSVEITPQGTVLTSNSDRAHLTVGIMPFLLHAKTRILDRMRELRSQEDLSSLREEVVENIADPSERERVESVFQAREEAGAEAKQRLAREAVETAAQEARLHHDIQERKERLDVEMRFRRSEIRRSYLQRDMIAGAVGPILLLGLAATIVTAMFNRVVVSGTVSDSFLLILGYFFGNATNQKQGAAGKKGGRKPARRSEPPAMPTVTITETPKPADSLPNAPSGGAAASA